MTRIQVYFILALALANSNLTRADEKEDPDDAAIRAVVMNYFSASEKLDADALAACLDERFAAPGSATKAEFVARMKAQFAKMQMASFKIKVRSIVHAGQQQARVRIVYTEKGKTKTGQVIDDEGHWALYVLRGADGWKILMLRDVYLDVIINAKAATTKEDRIAIFRAEGDDYIESEFLPTLFKEQAGIIDKGDFDLAGKFQEFAELAVAGLVDADRRELQEAIALMGRAKIAERLSNYDEAIAASRKSLDAFRKRGARAFEISIMINLSALLYHQGNFKEAIKVLEDARSLLSGLNEFAQLLNQAKLLGNLGAVYTELGEYGKAIHFLKEAVTAARKAGDREAEMNARLNLANIYVHQNKYAEALHIYEEVRQEYAAAGARAREGAVLNNIGNALMEQRLFAEAIRKFEAARQLCAAVRDRKGESLALMNLGIVHYRLDAVADAERYTEQGLKLLRDIGDKAGTCHAMMTVALLHQEAERYDKAAKVLAQCLEMAKATGRKDDLAQVYLALGLNFEQRGEPEEAVKAYDAASNFYSAARDPVRSALIRIKKACVRQKNGVLLVDLVELGALGGLAEQIDDPRVTSSMLNVRVLYHFENHNWKEAVADLHKAIAISERSRLAVEDPILKAIHGGSNLSKDYVHLAWALAQQNDAAGVYQASESFKARSLMELLERSRTRVRKGLTERELGDEQRLRESVAAATRQYYSSHQLAIKAAERTALRKEMIEAQARFDEFTRNLSLAHPDLSARQATFAPLDLKEVQSRVFERDSSLAILSYVVGKSNTLIVVLTPGDGADSRARIAVHRAPVGAQELRVAVDRFRDSCSGIGLGAPSSDELWKWLIAPVVAELAGKKRLVIVPCSPLLSLPFQALRDGDKPYLLEQFAISYAPAVTALSEMLELGERHRSQARKEQDNQAIPLLAVGRPLFSKELKDLPFTEPEAKAIAACYRDRGALLIGASATRKRVETSIGRAKVVHFATHGLVNGERPMFSALALTPDGKDDDGRLYAHDIMNLNLQADLVTLSACNTGLGREYAGEGTLGLAWAFFVAGSPSAITSQWSVADESTSRLMQAFYQNLTAQPARAKADALREAQLSLLKDPKTAHPFHWAPFVLVGDWR